MTTYLEKSCSFCLPRVPFVNYRQFMYLVISLFGFEGRIWDLIVSVPDHCLSFYYSIYSLFGGGTSSQGIFHVWKRNCRTSSHIIVSMWHLSGFLCNNPKCPGTQGRRPLCQSHLGGAVLNCDVFAVAPTGIVLVCSVLIKHDRISWTLGIRQKSRPKTAGTKLPKGPIRRRLLNPARGS